jgi:hypothetical protein
VTVLDEILVGPDVATVSVRALSGLPCADRDELAELIHRPLVIHPMMMADVSRDDHLIREF